MRSTIFPVVDYYKILGVDSQAGAAEIRAAYRSLVKVWHPDVNAAGAAKFKQITEANTVLADAKKRKEYDALLAAAAKNGAKQNAAKPAQSYSIQKANHDAMVIDLLNKFPAKERSKIKSLLASAERLGKLKADAHYGKIIGQFEAEAEHKVIKKYEDKLADAYAYIRALQDEKRKLLGQKKLR